MCEQRKFDTGAVRDSVEGKGRCDLLPADCVLRVAKTYQRGAEHYDARNWEKGVPASSFIDSALRHLLRWLDGDKTEDHLGAAVFNVFGLMRLEHDMPELVDIPKRWENPNKE